MPQLSPHTMLWLVAVLYLIVALLLLSSKLSAQKLNASSRSTEKKPSSLIYE